MRVGDFEVQVVGGREDADFATVLLKHGQAYQLALTSHLKYQRTDACVRIDGKEMGTFRVRPGMTITLERPVNNDGRFTFFRWGSPEAKSARLSADATSGLLTVQFSPEDLTNEKPRHDRAATRGAAEVEPLEDASSGSGLTGRSEQKFKDVADLFAYDSAAAIRIVLRMRCEPGDEPKPGNSFNVVEDHSTTKAGVGQRPVSSQTFPGTASETIVVCKACGQKNRIYRRALKGANRCAKCSTYLPEPFVERERSVREPPAMPVESSRSTIGRWVLVLLGVVIFVLALAKHGTSRSERLAQVAFPVGLPSTVSPLKPQQTRSRPNGEMIAWAMAEGEGTLTVANGTRYDAVVKLLFSSGGKAAVFYVRTGRSVVLQRVPDDQYSLIYTTGVDWDDAQGQFTRDTTYSRFGETLDFTTEHTQQANTAYRLIPRLRITLNTVVNGNVSIREISAAEFRRH